MPTRNVNLTDHLDRFVKAGVASGRYGNASEVIRDALRILEAKSREDRAKLESLRKAAKVGFDQLDRGESEELHSVEEFRDSIRRLRRATLPRLAAKRV